ncbi:MAG: translational GTPase TypA [Deltaproteobacteria bacterium]|nr:translational GTPase TypA [Deltaproteobacteria bacterium]
MPSERNNSIRNIAIIAHVDHGKTTLVDAMFRQSGLFREGQVVDERIMDSMELERERGITIAAKNCAVTWDGIKINIIDTPGHADFGGEVERALSMADGAILLVDASEGPLPQTRFVLNKALGAGLSLIIVINKIDREDARPDEVLNEIYDLLIDLGATDDQMESPILYAVGRKGIVMASPENPADNLGILFETILKHIPGPVHTSDAPFQMLVSDLGYSDYLGRLCVGKVVNGSVKSGEALACIHEDKGACPLKVSKLQEYQGLGLKETHEVGAGDIIVLSGIEDVHIGDTICTAGEPVALPRICVDEPTVFMEFMPNASPFAGKEGKWVQGTKIYDRLVRETLLNVSIQLEETRDRESFVVKGRGEFQMAILVETMRREGFELCVGRPRVIYKNDKDGRLMEPIEEVIVECAESYSGTVTETLLSRKGRLIHIDYLDNGHVNLKFSVPSRAMIGYRDMFLTDTRGTGILNSSYAGYEAFRGEFPTRYSGSLVSDRQGFAVPFALFNLEARGRLFIRPGEAVYEGMVIGEYNREKDIYVNPCKTKKLTNMRASGKDDAVTLTPVAPLTLEAAIRFIGDDELVEVTPKSVRIRKKILSQAMSRVAYKLKSA